VSDRRDARYLSPSAQEVLRLRAVAALVARRDREDVAALFGMSLKAVDMWWAKWQAEGRESLVMQPRGKPVGCTRCSGRPIRLRCGRRTWSTGLVMWGLSGQLWTRWLVGELIGKLYRARLTEPGVSKYFERCGLSFQRPDKRAAGRSSPA
jgi:transposase